MRTAAVLLVLLLAGCAAPPDAPAPQPGTGPIDLAGKHGLLLVDLEQRLVTEISRTSGQAWLSASGRTMVWQEVGYTVVRNVTAGTRDVAPDVLWVRIYDNGTGLYLDGSNAKWRELRTGGENGSAPIRPPPGPAVPWTMASDDLQVLGAEAARSSAAAASCRSDLYLSAPGDTGRTIGCHLRASADGRLAWTEGDNVRWRRLDGEVVNLTEARTGVRHENPAFMPEGLVHLRLTGDRLVEVVGADGETLARLEGRGGLALHDISADGRFLLLRTFAR